MRCAWWSRQRRVASGCSARISPQPLGARDRLPVEMRRRKGLSPRATAASKTTLPERAAIAAKATVVVSGDPGGAATAVVAGTPAHALVPVLRLAQEPTAAALLKPA